MPVLTSRASLTGNDVLDKKKSMQQRGVTISAPNHSFFAHYNVVN